MLRVRCSDESGKLGVVLVCEIKCVKKTHRPLLAMGILAAFRLSRPNFR